MEDYSEIVSEVQTEHRDTPPELVEAQRIQIDSDYGMRVRHQRELKKIAENSSSEEQLMMAMEFDFSVLITAIWNKYSEQAEIAEKIRGIFNK